MADRVKVIDSLMTDAIRRKNDFADRLEHEFNNHLADVNAYGEFWDGLAYQRFLQRYNDDRHTRVYIPQVVTCLRDQAAQMEQILRDKQANDAEMASRLG